MPTPEEDRRRYYRIADQIALEILPFGGQPEESAPLFSLLVELHQLELESQPLLRQISDSNRPLASYLTLQSRRLELLGQMLAMALLQNPGQPRPVTLSEGGISFSNPEPLPEQGLFNLKILLFPETLALLLPARVIYCGPDGQGQYAVGMEFETPTDTQRQLLARHVLKCQARQLRQTPGEH